MKIATWTCGLLAAVLFTGTLASAQSLAEVAKKEAERRKALKAPTKTFTTDDLKKYPDPATPAAPAASAPATPAPGQGQDAAAQNQAKDQPADAADAKDEAYWKKRMTDAREQLERTRSFLEAMQSRINALTADFYARDDPAQRDVLWTQRTKALQELDRLTKEAADQEKAVRDIQEEARRSGVPPGWLR